MDNLNIVPTANALYGLVLRSGYVALMGPFPQCSHQDFVSITVDITFFVEKVLILAFRNTLLNFSVEISAVVLASFMYF